MSLTNAPYHLTLNMQTKKNQHVTICFEKDTISELFSELLRARGIKTRIITSLNEAQGETKIITEPQYMPKLPNEYKLECLIVGNKESLKGLPGVQLSRPLTEQKIEAAFSRFLD